MRRALLSLAAFALIVPAAIAPLAPLAAKDGITDAQALAVVLADPRREADRGRDIYRHPAETMAFFRVKPGMTVVDYMPSSGWWTRVLVPYLGERGNYIGLNPDVTRAEDRMRDMFRNLGDKFPTDAAGWTGTPANRIAAYNTDQLPAALNESVDRVLIFREMHNLWRTGVMHRELIAVRALLKKDGMLGIEQHRARNNASAGYTVGTNGYLRERDVIALVEAHGFQLVGKSEINANKRDPANHPQGVWMLPPNLRGVANEAERARMLEIGESDRMTLLFRKRS